MQGRRRRDEDRKGPRWTCEITLNDKTVRKTLNITGSEPQTAPTSGQLVLKIDFSSNVNLSFAIDDGINEKLNFGSGDSKTFTAKRKILLSTSDAGATKITLNGQSLGPMGRTKEQLSNIPFLAQSDTINTEVK